VDGEHAGLHDPSPDGRGFMPRLAPDRAGEKRSFGVNLPEPDFRTL